MNVAPGARVGSYEILAAIGAGGMGSVYRARDPRLGREIAIKILQDRFAGNREYLNRFEQEARAASALNHPNIITIYEIDEMEGIPFIAMELVEGTRLRDVLRGGAMSLRKLLSIGAQMAEGLAVAHERGIVHRDLKPENVMITPDGRVKILDFGLARLRREPTSPDETTSELLSQAEGRVIGTAGYMSPEQASGSEVDFRSDQFSFGAILYEMAAGRRPFQRSTPLDTLSAIVHEEPESIDQANPKLPAPLRWAITRCLSKDPRDRYASTRDLARDLQTLREHVGETTTAESTRVLTPWMGRRAAVFALPILVLVVLAAGIWMALHQEPRPAATSAVRSLAMLPLKDRSQPPVGNALGIGMAEILTARLADADGIQVIAPSAAVKLVGEGASYDKIAQELGANMIFDGSYRRSGDRALLAYSIVDPKGLLIAGDTLDEPTSDYFLLQEKLARSVFDQLDLKVRKTSRVSRGLETAEVQEQYIEALGHLDEFESLASVDRGITLLERLASTAPGSALVQAALGRAYLYKYDLSHEAEWASRATAACERAIALDPANPEVHLTLGNLNMKTGKTAEAIASLRTAVSLQPNSAIATLALGDAHRRNGDLAETERLYLRGISLRPEWWSGYNKVGSLYLQQNQPGPAEKMLRQALQYSPGNPWAQGNLGALYMRQKKFEPAIEIFKASAPDAGNLSNLGTAYYFTGKLNEAAGALEKATTMAPNKSKYWRNLGDTYRWLPGRRKDSEAAFQRAIKAADNELTVNAADADAHATLALCYAKLGDHARAKKHMSRAVTLDSDPQRIYQAGLVAALAGEQESAMKLMKRAFEAGYPPTEAERDPELTELRKVRQFEDILRVSNPI